MNAVSKISAGCAVYSKIAAVQGELAKVGIAKDRRNSGQGYNFRGIDDVYAALSPLLAKYGLVIIPRVIERVVVERAAKGGGALFNVTVKAEFDFIAAEDGSIHTASTYGEAMDSGDKATNKAMSAAYKYAAFMTFAIPTEGDNDADGTTHEIVAGGQREEGASSAPGGNPPIKEMPDAEWAKLVALIEATGSNAGWLSKHYVVRDLRHLNQDQYADALANLNDKLSKLAKASTDAKAAQVTPAKPNFAEELGDAISF